MRREAVHRHAAQVARLKRAAAVCRVAVAQGSSSLRHAARFRRLETPIAQRASAAIDTASRGGARAADTVPPAPWGDATAARLRTRHWRQAPRARRPSRVPLLLALALHALFAAMVWQALRTTLPLSEPPNHALVARFVPIVLPERVVRPEPGVPVKPRTVTPRRTVEPPPPRQRPDAADVTTTATLYDRDGQPLLPPPAPGASTATPGYVQRLPQGDAQVMRHANPLPYQPTRLDPYFPPPDESAGGAAVRKLKDAVVGSKAVDLPGGIHLKCKTLLGIPTPDCADPPAPQP